MHGATPTDTIALSHDTSVVDFIDELIKKAIEEKASDIHFEPDETQYRIRFRIDGLLTSIAQPNMSLAKRFAARLKVMADLDLSENRLPQDGRFQFQLSDNQVRHCRISTCPTLFGEKVVIRLLELADQSLRLASLGLSSLHESLLLQAMRHPQGMVLVTGPTGSGKTLTLYTCLTELNTDEKNILTVEDPIEMNLTGINQVAIHPKIGLTFSAVLRAFLRQDPDILMIGEIRDLETADIAIKAAQTGHLVFSTLHTNSATDTLIRLINMGVAGFNLSASVSLIIAQRLVRRLCEQCKAITSIPESVLSLASLAEMPIEQTTCYQASGCHHCRKGYQGRFALYEMLPMSQTITDAMTHAESPLLIESAVKQLKLPGLFHAGLAAVLSGQTSLAELNRVIKMPRAVDR